MLRLSTATALHASVLLAAMLCACKDRQDDLRGDEQLKVLVATDRKLAAEEDALLARRGALQRERGQVRDKRAALVDRKMALPEEDTAGKEELEREESQLVKIETQLADRELQLNKKLEQLLEKKSDLAGQATGNTKEDMLRRREYGIALREKDVARREADIGRRERDMAGREQTLAVRQAKLCPQVATTTVIQRVAERPAGRSYAAADVEPVYRSALRAMREKGLLVADLPPGVDRLVTETRHAVARKDYTQAKFAADQLLSSVRKITIDRAFIGAKISRLSAAMARKPPSGADKEQATGLFRKATAAYGDGRFSAANGVLNQIYGLLR
jgi:hypothetical protein